MQRTYGVCPYGYTGVSERMDRSSLQIAYLGMYEKRGKSQTRVPVGTSAGLAGRRTAK